MALRICNSFSSSSDLLEVLQRFCIWYGCNGTKFKPDDFEWSRSNYVYNGLSAYFVYLLVGLIKYPWFLWKW